MLLITLIRGDIMNSNFIYIFSKNEEDFSWNYSKNHQEYLTLKEQLRSILIRYLDKDHRTFVVEVSQVFGMIANDLLKELKKDYYFIKVYGIIPYRHNDLKWSYKKRVLFQNALDVCNNIYTFSYDRDDILTQSKRQFILGFSPITIVYSKNNIISI